jgi:hypothetical protein
MWLKQLPIRYQAGHVTGETPSDAEPMHRRFDADFGTICAQTL